MRGRLKKRAQLEDSLSQYQHLREENAELKRRIFELETEVNLLRQLKAIPPQRSS